jgi:hypothetical protein
MATWLSSPSADPRSASSFSAENVAPVAVTDDAPKVGASSVVVVHSNAVSPGT